MPTLPVSNDFKSSTIQALSPMNCVNTLQHITHMQCKLYKVLLTYKQKKVQGSQLESEGLFNVL